MSSMNDFKVMQSLGKGSYGSVFKCRRLADGKEYAVKEVNIRKLSPREREDAVNEIRILASFSHPHIIGYCDAFVERDNLYIVMDFAEQGDVYRQIKRFRAANKYIKEDTIWSYLIQMCLGLKELHSRRIVHRDIKPKNVFLSSKHHIRLGDMGCAKLMKSGLARTQIGTPYYMSPEIWACRPYDQKSDMWALGCFIYEMCALNPPFMANDMQSLARKVKTAPAPRISRHYSDELADLVAMLLSKSARARPSVDQVLEMAAVERRMHLLPEAATVAPEGAPGNLLATIKVPHDLGRGGRAKLKLPDPSYPTEQASVAPRPGTSPAKIQRDAGPARGGGAIPRSTSPIVSPAKRAAAAAAAAVGYRGGSRAPIRVDHGEDLVTPKSRAATGDRPPPSRAGRMLRRVPSDPSVQKGRYGGVRPAIPAVPPTSKAAGYPSARGGRRYVVPTGPGILPPAAMPYGAPLPRRPSRQLLSQARNRPGPRPW